MPLRCDVASLESLALSRVGQVVTKVHPSVLPIFAIMRRFGFGCKLIRPFHILHNWSQVVVSAGEWAGASPGISLGGQAAPQVGGLVSFFLP